MFTLCRSCVSWKTQLHSTIALSSTEAEYITTTKVVKDAL